MNTLLNIECSMFRNAKATDPQTVNLLQWLKSDKYVQQQQKIRSLTNEAERKEAKIMMPCIAPSGVFSKRGAAYLQKHTGLISIDIDLKDNQSISNFADLKKQLCNIPNVAYCGLSVSGKSYWLLIPIAYPEKHDLHFRFIEIFFASKGLKIDPACKDVARLRFYSYDPNAYFNYTATLLQAYYKPSPPKPIKYRQSSFHATIKPIWEQYNESDDFMNVLQNYGWKIDSKRGSKTYFTRPEKDSGISAEFDDGKNIFYVFTSSAAPLEGGRGYTPFQVYAILKHSSDFSRAAKTLMPRNQKKVAFNLPQAEKNIPIILKPTAVEQFKASLLKEAIETGNGIADKWFEIYHKQGLSGKDALAAVYELSREHGLKINE